MNCLILANLKRSAEPFWAGLLGWSPWHGSLPKDIQVHFWLAGLIGCCDIQTLEVNPNLMIPQGWDVDGPDVPPAHIQGQKVFGGDCFLRSVRLGEIR